MMNSISSLFFRESDQKRFFDEVKSFTSKNKAGIVKTLQVFAKKFKTNMSFIETEIVNIVLPQEVERLKNKEQSYAEFIQKNTVYALDYLVESEIKVVKKAFLSQSLQELTSAKYKKDRQILKIDEREISFQVFSPKK